MTLDKAAGSEAETVVNLGHSVLPLYIQLSTLFRRRIESGEWGVNEQIPTVLELAAQFGVAPATVRQALSILEEESLIERLRAKGTFVRHRPQDEQWCVIRTAWSGPARPRYSETIEVLSDTRNQVLRDVVYQIGEMAPAYRRLRRRHWRDGKAFLISNVDIDERLRGGMTQEDLETKTTMELLHNIPDLETTEIRQTMTVGTADVESARMLKTPINAPVAHVYRRAVDGENQLVFIAEGIYRADVIRIDIKLK